MDVTAERNSGGVESPWSSPDGVGVGAGILALEISILAVSLAVEKCGGKSTSMICNPLPSSATKAVLPSAERAA